MQNSKNGISCNPKITLTEFLFDIFKFWFLILKLNIFSNPYLSPVHVYSVTEAMQTELLFYISISWTLCILYLAEIWWEIWWLCQLQSSVPSLILHKNLQLLCSLPVLARSFSAVQRTTSLVHSLSLSLLELLIYPQKRYLYSCFFPSLPTPAMLACLFQTSYLYSLYYHLQAQTCFFLSSCCFPAFIFSTCCRPSWLWASKVPTSSTSSQDFSIMSDPQLLLLLCYGLGGRVLSWKRTGGYRLRTGRIVQVLGMNSWAAGGCRSCRFWHAKDWM